MSKVAVATSATTRQCHLYGIPELPSHYLVRTEDITILKLILLSYVSKVMITGNTWRAGSESIGGIGKTVLATALARDQEVQRAFPDGILWVSIGQHPRIPLLQTRIAAALGDTTWTYQDEHQGRIRLRQLFKDRACLLILDDVWNIEHITACDVLGPHSRMLITTRQTDLVQKTGAAEQRIHPLQDNQALRLLSLWTGILFEKLPPESHKIARECGNNPLALAMLGTLLRYRPAQWNSILYRLRKVDLEKIEKKFAEHPYPHIIRTLQISFESLERDVQQKFLSLAVFPEHAFVPQHVIETYWSSFGMDLNHVEDIMDILVGCALVIEEEDEHEQEHYRLHDLILYYTRTSVRHLRYWHNRLLDAYRAKLTSAIIQVSEPPTSNRDSSAGMPSSLWTYLPTDETYMWNNLIHHMVEAECYEELHDLLLDYAWIEACLHATNINTVIAAFDESQQRVSPVDSFDFFDEPTPDTQLDTRMLVRDALRLSAHILVADKAQLPGQLIGRLGSFNEPDIQAFLQRIHQHTSTTRWLCPLTASLTPPGRPLLRTIDHSEDTIFMAIALASDGRHALTASDLDVQVWDIEQGQILATLSGHTDRVWDVAISMDGTRAVSASADTTIRVWDVQTQQCIATLTGHQSSVWAVAITPDGTRIASASDDHTVRIWDSTSGKLIQTLQGHEDRVRAVAITSDGTMVMSASNDTTVHIWDVAYGRLTATLKGHTDWVRALALTPDGSRAVTGSLDCTLKIWDIENQIELATLEGHSKEILAVAITSDGRKAVSASADQTLRIWNLNNKTLVRTLEGHTAGVNSVALSLYGQEAISTAYDGTMRVWNVARVQIPASLEGHQAGVTSILITPDSKRAVSASHDYTLKVWDTTTGALLSTMKGHRGGVNTIAMCPDGRHVASASFLEPMKLWNLDTCSLIRAFDRHDDWIMAIDILANERQLVSVSDEGLLTFWDTTSGAVHHTANVHHDAKSLKTVVIRADHQQMFLVTDEGTLLRYDMHNETTIPVFDQQPNIPATFAVTSDGQRLVTSAPDYSLHVWDMNQRTLLHTLSGHTHTVNAIVLTPDNCRAVSVSNDHTLTLWDIVQGHACANFTADRPLIACSVSPDGSLIVAGDESGRMHFLRLG